MWLSRRPKLQEALLEDKITSQHVHLKSFLVKVYGRNFCLGSVAKITPLFKQKLVFAFSLVFCFPRPAASRRYLISWGGHHEGWQSVSAAIPISIQPRSALSLINGRRRYHPHGCLRVCCFCKHFPMPLRIMWGSTPTICLLIIQQWFQSLPWRKWLGFFEFFIYVILKFSLFFNNGISFRTLSFWFRTMICWA